MTNQERDDSFDVLFTGKELLCIAEPDPSRLPASTDRSWTPRAWDHLLKDRQIVYGTFREPRPYSRGELRMRTGMSALRFDTALRRLQLDGQVERIGFGLWRIVR